MISILFVALGVALVSALAITSMRSPHHLTQPQTTSVSRQQNNPLVGPCNGEEIAPAQIAKALPFPPYEPHDPLANSSNASRAWDCPGDDVIVEYESGISLDMGPNTMRDPEAAYAVLAAKYPREMEVGKARGTVALVANIYPETGAVGGISVVEGDARLIVNGNGELSLQDLQRVMESLRQEQ